MNRRDFLRMTAGAGLLAVSKAAPGLAEMSGRLPPEAVGILYDATLCIGCKSCMVNCKRVNSMPGGSLYHEGSEGIPYEHRTPLRIYDAPEDLSARTLNIIKVSKRGTGEHKDRPEDGYSFVKQHCLHCIAPACVSACPVAALKKDPRSGVVYYEKERCIGCRYCQLACPFHIPKFEWDSTSPRIVKCQLCRHRMDEGGYAACCEFCPTGASIYGRVTALREEAERRLALRPGGVYDFPVRTVDASYRLSRPVSAYVPHVYGLEEAGGTQYLTLAGVPLDLLGYNSRIGNGALPDLTWKYISKIPVVAAAVIAAGAAGWFLTRRNNGPDKED